MEEKTKSRFIQILILIAVVVLIFVFMNRKSDGTSFNDAFKDANKRLDTIQYEITKSQSLIQKTQSKLDSIEARVKLIKGAQQQSNTVVSANDAEMQQKLKIQEAKLRSLTLQYNEVQKEKNILSSQLDSIAQRIQSDL